MLLTLLPLATGFVAASAVAEPGDAQVQIRSISAAGVIGLSANTFTLEPAGAPYTMATHYAVDERDYLFVGSGHSGEFTITELVNGASAGVVQTGSLGGLGWRAVGVTHRGGETRLYVVKPDSGEVLSYLVLEDGRLDLASDLMVVAPKLAHTNVLDLMVRGLDSRVFALDTYAGGLVIQKVSGAPLVVAQTADSAGWTTVDHVEVDGTLYRALHKEAGDPFIPAGQADAEDGRTRILAVAPDGLDGAQVYDSAIPLGFQHIRFAQVDAAIYAFVLYRRDGFTMSRTFNPFVSGGTGAVMNQTTTGPNYDEVLTYRRDGVTYMVGIRLDLNVDPVTHLTQDHMARLAQCVRDNLDGRTGGYQLSVLQQGRQRISDARGFKRITPSTLPVARDTRINMGSVGKLMTTITTLAVADDGSIHEDDAIASRLDPQRYPPGIMDDWVSQRSVLDLMAQTTGHSRDTALGCTESNDLTIDCTPFLTQTPTNADDCINGMGGDQRSCARDYVNPHFSVLRSVIEAATGVETASDLDAFTRERWLNAITPSAPSCEADMQSKLFGICKDGQTCATQGGMSYLQGDPDRIDGWGANCAQGEWEGSADSMVAVLEALNAGQILSPARTALMLSTTFTDSNGDGTALGFGAPYTARTGGSLMLGKDGGGGNQAGMTTFLTQWDGHAQAALFINSMAGPVPYADTLLAHALDHALGAQPRCDRLLTFASRSELTTEHDAGDLAMVDLSGSRFAVAHQSGSVVKVALYKRVGLGVQEDGLIEEDAGDLIAIEKVDSDRFVVAKRNALGNLELRVYRAGPLGGLTLRHTWSSGGVQALAVATLYGVGPEFALAIVDSNNKLKVIAWNVNANDRLERKGEYLSLAAVSEVSVTHAKGDGRLVVATRVGGKVTPIFFEVSQDGMTVTRLGTAAAAATESGTNVRVSQVQSPTFEPFYVTSSKDSDGKLRLVVWTTSADGMVVGKNGARTASVISKQGDEPRSGRSPFLYVPVLDDAGKARLFSYSIRAGGAVIEGEGQPDSHGTGSEVAVLSASIGGVDWATTAFADKDGKLRFINWQALTGAP